MPERIEPNIALVPKNSNNLDQADIDMEHELGQLLRSSAAPQPLVKRVNDLGKMSGEAIMAQYEAAATAVEDMGNEVKERIAQLEAAMEECHKDMRLITEAAVFIREKGAAMRAQIEKASEVSNDIRNAVDEFKRKVGE